jgi:tRNA(Arg) A34 adenosine deaminase TadA
MDIYVDICKKEALKSSLVHKHGAVLIHRSQVLAISHNKAPHRKKNTSTDNGKNNNRYFDKGFSFIFGGQHAEVSVIHKFIERYPRRMLSNCTMVVIRINNVNDSLYSKPCKHCQNYISRYNVGKVYYSI